MILALRVVKVLAAEADKSEFGPPGLVLSPGLVGKLGPSGKPMATIVWGAESG